MDAFLLNWKGICHQSSVNKGHRFVLIVCEDEEKLFHLEDDGCLKFKAWKVFGCALND